MKTILFIIAMLFSTCTFCQTDSTTVSDTCFTTEQIHDISMTLDSLYQLDSINRSVIQLQDGVITNYEYQVKLDSLEIKFLNENVSLLEGNIEDYIKINEQLKPKWYDKPIIYFVAGIVTTTAIANYVVVTVR